MGISGGNLAEFIHDLDTTNTVNGKPVYLIKNQSDLVIDSSWNTGFLAAVNSENVTVKDLAMSNNVEGILFAYTNDSKIEDIACIDDEDGIYFYESSDNVIIGCNLTSNNKNGIYITSSYNNSIYHNKFIDNIVQGYDNMDTNNWDNGYPSGGNYWSDYECLDDNGDGIGDVPYIIAGNAGAEDRYPLCYTQICKGDFDDFVEFAGVYGTSCP